MTTVECNHARPLSFTGKQLAAISVTNARNYHVSGPAIVVNVGTEDVYIDETPRKRIPPLSSTILVDTTIERAGMLVMLEIDDRPDVQIKEIIHEPGWDLLGVLMGDSAGVTGGVPFDKKTQLWKSPEDVIGNICFDPSYLLLQEREEGARRRFEVKVNLWFAPAGTDCFIHNEHDFIEVHTQVHGTGRMQKFREQDRATLYQDVLMSPGYTTPDPFCTIRADGSYVYPWHQYYADTDSVWLAVEYHRITQ